MSFSIARGYGDRVASGEPRALHDLLGHRLAAPRTSATLTTTISGLPVSSQNSRSIDLLLAVQRHGAHRLALVEVLLDAMQERDQLRFLLLLQARALLGPLETLGHRLEVGELQLELEHVDVADRVDAALDMGDVGILERAHHERGCVGLADVCRGSGCRDPRRGSRPAPGRRCR